MFHLWKNGDFLLKDEKGMMFGAYSTPFSFDCRMDRSFFILLVVILDVFFYVCLRILWLFALFFIPNLVIYCFFLCGEIRKVIFCVFVLYVHKESFYKMIDGFEVLDGYVILGIVF